MIYLIVSFIWWQFLSAVIVSDGYHRYFAHGAFKTGTWYEYLVLALGPLSGSGKVLGWVGVHRLHHNHFGTKEDPTNPQAHGFWAILTSTFEVPAIKPRIIRDLLKNPRVMWFHKHHFKIRIATFILAFALLPFWWAVVLVVSPIIYGYVGFGLINTLCHLEPAPAVGNSWIANIFTGGEGWHEYHHDNPGAWKIGQKWYEWDLGATFIRMIKYE